MARALNINITKGEGDAPKRALNVRMIKGEGNAPKRALNVVAYGDIGGGSGGDGDEYPVVGDGKTYIHINVPQTDSNGLTFLMNIYPIGSCAMTVDWGDGSEIETYSGSSKPNTTHTYTVAGDYTIVIDVTEGTVQYGQLNTIFIPTTYAYNRLMIQAIEIGSNGFSDSISVSYDYSGYYNCKKFTIPDSATTIGTIANSSMESALELPSALTSITYVQYCKLPKTFVLPSGLTAINTSAFQYCHGAEVIDLGSSLTSITNSSAFAYCPCNVCICRATTPPTLQGANSLPQAIVYYVPAASVAAYKAASRWSDYAARIFPIPEGV